MRRRFGRPDHVPYASGTQDRRSLDEVLRLKPASSKGRYITKATVTTTNGPGILVDQNKTRNLTEEDADAA